MKHTKNGWGTLAIGTRISKHPEVGFFTSWTAMLTGGLHQGDTVLLPQAHMPAHQAANTLARDFLRSGKDSLLLIDDDMRFDPDAVARLRANQNNWPYDIVFAFCTHRVWPPKPVILRVSDKQPGEPESIHGQLHDIVYEFEDGDVVPVDTVGLAFTLISRRVFEALTDPVYGPDYTYFFDYGRGRESDDISFCRRARAAGFTLAVDTSVKIEHISSLPLGWTQYQAWRKDVTTVPPNIELGLDELTAILKAAGNDPTIGERAEFLLKDIERGL